MAVTAAVFLDKDGTLVENVPYCADPDRIRLGPGALEGLNAEPGVRLLSASTPSEWVESVLRLLDDPSLRHHLGSAGRQYVEAHHRWERCLEPLNRLLGLTMPGEKAVPISCLRQEKAGPAVVTGKGAAT